MEFFLLLPLSGIAGYLRHHGVALSGLPWKFVLDNDGLPLSTQPPCDEWISMLTKLLHYLHGVMKKQETAYSSLYTLLHNARSTLTALTFSPIIFQ